MARVLVIEDDTDLTYLYETSLRQSGHQPTVATTARDALFELSQNTYQAILLDLNLPDAYGTVIIDFILRDSRHRVGQIIVITATDNWGDELSKRGVQQVMIKPISMSAVIDAVESLR
jgi:DNA-binding response OmpR family regulator